MHPVIVLFNSISHILNFLYMYVQNTGWWTYKFCYLKEITQFHREQQAANVNDPAVAAAVAAAAQANANQANNAGGAGPNVQPAIQQTKMVVTAEFILGQIGGDTPYDVHLANTKIVPGENWESSYVSQVYTDGTVCDLNNKPRQIESRIYCGIADKAHQIKNVVESSTCEYIITIQTPLLCSHPQFKPEVAKVHEIVCHPLVDDPLPIQPALATESLSSTGLGSETQIGEESRLKDEL